MGASMSYVMRVLVGVHYREDIKQKQFTHELSGRPVEMGLRITKEAAFRLK